MSRHQPRFLVTGASGQLGQLVIAELLASVPAADIAATVRSADAAARLAALGVRAHIADYSQPETFAAPLAGIERLLLISSSAIGPTRAAHHGGVIAAAKRAGVGLIAYTSVLHAGTSKLGLAADHRATEAALRESGLKFVLLRNGWYTENHTAAIPPALAHNAMIGAAGEGRFSAAARADYAAAAVAVLTRDEDFAGRAFELAGDTAYTLAEFAAELSRQAGKQVPYVNLPEAEYKAALLGAGLPEPVAELVASSDTAAATGALFDDGRQLSKLIGRPTTKLAESIAAALAQK